MFPRARICAPDPPGSGDATYAKKGERQAVLTFLLAAFREMSVSMLSRKLAKHGAISIVENEREIAVIVDPQVFEMMRGIIEAAGDPLVFDKVLVPPPPPSGERKPVRYLDVFPR
jgi:hypothetical protein